MGSPGPEPYGSVVVSLNAASDDGDAFSTLTARFFDAPTPQVIPLVLETELDDCQLLVPALPFCAESCAPGVCTADDECTAYPAPVSVGTLAIEGLGESLMLEPASSMQVYQAPSMPNPPCVEGEPVSASAPGLTLEAQCIGQLELTGPDPIPVSSGAAVSVAWVAAAEPSGSRVRIRLDIAHHGGKKGEIQCEVPDTGAFDIPEPLVTQLIGLGVAGYPDISVTRVSVGVDAKHPGTTLVLSSNVLRPVDTGVVSCQDKSQCSAEQDCLDTQVCG